MAQEFSQKEGVDYHEVFSPVVNHNVTPRFPVRSDWRIRTGFRGARPNWDSLPDFFFFKAELIPVGMAHIL